MYLHKGRIEPEGGKRIELAGKSQKLSVGCARRAVERVTKIGLKI